MPLQAHRYRHPLTGVLALACLLACTTASGAEEVAPTPAFDVPLASLATRTGSDTHASAPALKLDTRLRTAAIMAASVGGTLAYGRAKWWGDGFTGDFKTASEGWFGKNTEHGGVDKLGHGMFAYVGTRLMTRAYAWAGNDADTALNLGLWTAVGTLMAVEVLDGYAKKWRFSREDAIANLAGGALGYLMEKSPALDALVDIRLQYSPSKGPQGRRSFDPMGDYSGQRFQLVFKASGIPALHGHSWLRYLELSAGYGARNFDDDVRNQIRPSRHAYFGVSLNLSEILRNTVYKNHLQPSSTQRLTETFFEFVHLPVAGVQRDHRIR